jgi:hypothetical protein
VAFFLEGLLFGVYMKILILLSVLLYSSYSLGGKPRWINDTSRGCNKNELCAVGEGESRSFALISAKTALAKIFSLKIKSKFSQEISSHGGYVSDDTSEQIEEATEAALEGVEIKKVYEGKLYVYALAAINKRKAARGFESEIRKIDEKMQVYVNDSSASSATKLQHLFIKREGLNKRYEFLVGHGITSAIRFKQVFDARKKRVGNVIVHVFIDERKPKILEPQIAQLLVSQGYKVTTGRVRNKLSSHILTGRMTPEKQYMKIDGFETFKFQVELSSSNYKRVETGHIVFSDIETGRSYQQAYEKAVPVLMDNLKENINKLNFD